MYISTIKPHFNKTIKGLQIKFWSSNPSPFYTKHKWLEKLCPKLFRTGYGTAFKYWFFYSSKGKIYKQIMICGLCFTLTKGS